MTDRLPAQIAHFVAMGRRPDRDVTVKEVPRGYRVHLKATLKEHTRELSFELRRKGRRFVDHDPQLWEDGEIVDTSRIKGGLLALLRALSTSGDLVGAPRANTRMPGSDPNLKTRAHTIIRN